MRKIITAVLILIFIFVSGFLFWEELSDFYSDSYLYTPDLKGRLTDLINETKKYVSTPPPLQAVQESHQSFLTEEGIIKWTNEQRIAYGISPFKENFQLNMSAQLKAEDMLEKQYFSHESPSGEGLEDLADKAGYKYIFLGENLAMGNFQDDKTIVEAWMESPGHKENIINSRYEEIGVAVIKGEFNGLNTWLAVQHFGLSSSACPQVDEMTIIKIEEKQKAIKELEKEINILANDIRTIRPRRGESYDEKVEQYNELVYQYNELVEEVTVLINDYNSQVKLYNECVAGF